jgi:membrane-bound lytic murein transglycosylase B
MNATGMLRWSACALLALAAASAGALDLARDDVQKFMGEMRDKHGFDADWLAATMEDAESQPRILERISKPAEQTMTWGAYRRHLLTPERIAAGLEFWIEHRARIAETAEATGVAEHVIIGILGVETYYGRITGRERVIDALSTLAFDYPPRAGFFRAELEQFLLLTREHRVDASAVLGSYAGAMGRAQFMPSSYRAYAVDGDGDDRSDLWGSWDDVFASIANYLARHGWRAGEPVLAPAGLWFPRADGLVPGGRTPDTTVKALRDFGLRFETTQEGAAPALFVRVDGDQGAELRAGFHNFGVITKYNRSVLYALAVEDLGRRIEALLPAAP